MKKIPTMLADEVTPDMLQPEIHEQTYQHLKAQGHQGWGGEKLADRMAGWNQTAQALLSSPEFPKPGSEILELGSGAGDSLLPFAKNYQVTGIDISPTASAWAKEKIPFGTFLSGSVTDLSPFGGATFDAVLDGACLHCLTWADRNKALSEIYRVLKPGGFFLVSHMVNDPRELPSETTFDPKIRTQIRAGRSYRSMPIDMELLQILAKTGFKVIKHETRQNPWWDHLEAWCIKS